LAHATSYRLQWLRLAAAIAAFLPLAEATPACAQTAGPVLRGSAVAGDQLRSSATADDPSPVPPAKPARKKQAKAVQPVLATQPAPAEMTVEALAAATEAQAVATQSAAATPAAAPKFEYERNVTTRINTTGQPLSLPIAIKDGRRDLGEITLRVETDDAIFLPRQILLEKIGPSLTPAARERLAALPEKDGRVALAAMEQAGLGLSFNASQFELSFDPGANERAEGILSLGGQSSGQAEPSIQAAKVSGYLNVIGGVDQTWKVRPGQTADASGRVDLQGAVRLRGVVLESEATVDGLVDANRCNTGSLCTYQHKEGLKRRGSRATYDRPEDQLRLQIGDVDTASASYVRGVDTLGVGIEKSARKLAPGENIRASGQSSFRIERQSEVDVIVNGAVIRHFQLRPGSYNLRDLPFTSGANEVELAISDDSGERKSLKFSSFYDQSALGAGKTEWSLTAGAPSYLLDGDRKYDTSGRTGAALLRHGITDTAALEASAQADLHVATGSVGLFLQTKAGVVSVQPAASTTDGKVGYGGRASWDLVGFRGSLGLRESIRITADYRDKSFRTPGDQYDLATKIFQPQALYKLRLTGSHSVSLPQDLTATLSARYQFDNPEATSVSPYVVRGNRYGADLTLARALTPWMSGSVLAGYSNETYLNGFQANFNNAKPEFRAAVRLFIRPAERASITAAYDTLNKSSQVSALQTAGDGIGRWDASANGQRIGTTGNTNLGGSLGYTGNRAEVRVSHSVGADSITYPGLKAVGEDERTSLRVGSAIAFADGMVAVGAPIRGGSFAIVKPHATLAGKEVVVGSDGQVSAKTDWLGPALVSNLPAYSNANIPVDVTDLPVGYSLGAGSFDVRAPHKGGFALEVGSSYAITAFGVLEDAEGQPLSLQSGVASPDTDRKIEVAVFTNSAGRFGADGLAPGRWTLRMEGANGPLAYVIDVPEKTEGLYKAGTLRPGGVAAKE
jgi:outer membrane usher protein